MSADETVRRTAPPGLVIAALRDSAAQVLAVVTRRIGDVHDAEDAVHEAMTAATQQWPHDGHPSLSRPLQVALILRTVGGLTTREIARGLLLSEKTVAQRISRAKATLRRGGAQFTMPDATALPARASAAVHVLGVVHTEAHSATEGDAPVAI